MPVYPDGHILSQWLECRHLFHEQGVCGETFLFHLGPRKADEMSLPVMEHVSGFQIAMACLWPHKCTLKILFPKYFFKNKLARQVPIFFFTCIHVSIKLHSQGPHTFHPSGSN